MPLAIVVGGPVFSGEDAHRFMEHLAAQRRLAAERARITAQADEALARLRRALGAAGD